MLYRKILEIGTNPMLLTQLYPIANTAARICLNVDIINKFIVTKTNIIRPSYINQDYSSSLQ
jgi:hypothetical protein